MSKRSRARKAAALLAAVSSNNNNNNGSGVGQGNSVPGGLVGAAFRNQNGQATAADIDFLIRMSREAKGKDGYSGMSHTHSNPTFKGTGDSRFTFYKKDEAVFHCAEASEIVAKCPLNPLVPHILIPITMWDCFLSCCKEYDTEWIALLIGKLGKDSTGAAAYIIDKFYFPPQTASGAHVDVPTGVKPKPGTIGAIHSHVNMGVFWSGTDTAHSNWPVEIVINRKEEYESLSRYQLKCGEWAKGKSEVRLTGSYVNHAIDAQVKAAFAAGDSLDKVNRAAMVSRIATQPVASPVIPATTPTPAIVTSGYWEPSCTACNHYSHKQGEGCQAKDCKCTAAEWKSETMEVCSTNLCVRFKDHAGYHKTKAGDYFQYKADDPKPDEPAQGQITWPYPEQLTGTASDDGPVDEIGELPSEEYCSVCEGCGSVTKEGKPASIMTADDVKDCVACEGTGLSALGKIRAAESMLN